MATSPKISTPGTPFASWLDELDTEQREIIEKALRDVIDAVESNKAPGSVTINLKVVPAGKRQAAITPSVTSKCPRPKLDSRTFWIAPGHDLATEDPLQQKLPLNRVPRLRSVKDAAAGDDSADTDKE